MGNAETQPIFLWNGKYVGFVLEGYFFDRYGNWVGWVDEEGAVWEAGTGTLLGELVEESYVLRRVGQAPKRAAPPPPPTRPAPAEPSAERPPRDPKEGWEDTLAKKFTPSGHPKPPV